MDFQCLHCHHLHHCPQGLCRCHCKHPGRNKPATSRREMPVHLYHLEVCVVDWPHSGLPACWHFQLVLRLVLDGQWLLRGEDWLMRWLCMHISKIGETKREKKKRYMSSAPWRCYRSELRNQISLLPSDIQAMLAAQHLQLLHREVFAARTSANAHVWR
jgi:hypothetical protein